MYINTFNTFCMLGHKWQHNTEDITISQRKMGSHLYNTMSGPVQVRLCLRCNKKQRRVSNWLQGSVDWIDTPLSKEEERQIKLEKLL